MRNYNYIIVALMTGLLGACATASDKPNQSEDVKQLAAPSKAEQIEQKEIAEEEEDLQLLAGLGTGLGNIQKQDLAPSEVDANGSKSAIPETLQIPNDPNTFLVTVDIKNERHPSYGVGDKRGFYINGTPGDTVYMNRGEAYIFQVRTGVQHDFYLSTKGVGQGGAVYLNGVKGHFTYRGDVTLKTDASTPSTLYYQCRNHKSMGGKIRVVEPGTDIAALKQKEQKLPAPTLVKASIPKKEAKIDSQKAKQKLAYAEMLVKIKSKSLSDAAVSKYNSQLAEARQALTDGNNEESFEISAAISEKLSSHISKAGPSKEELEEQRLEYVEVLEGVKSIQASHATAMKSAEKSGGKIKAQDYDKSKVEKLLSIAEDQASDQEYKSAIKALRKVEREVTSALNSMLSEQTIVYELKFDTPEDEYKHEVGRYKGYDELVPVAIEMRKPSSGALQLMEQFKKKADFFAEKAEESAKAGRYAEAIVIVRDATLEIRRGLMALGVTM
ncbi:MAG: hypothetical protein OEZ47_07445 [Gammaproteobacteria bacterium]|nr:hypothetical protein [Gammaproteobacteria bacterium]